MQRPGALAASPDGRWFVASVASPAYEDDQKSSDLWIMASDGSTPPRRLTAGKGSEGDPAWSPDSTRIAFSAKREGDDAAQIYVLDLAGGEAQRVTNWPAAARAPRFSPDGRSILFVGLTYPGAVTEEDNRKAAADRKARKYNVRAYDSFPIRHWDRWLDELRPTLVVQPLDGAAPARDLLAGTALRRERGYGGRLGNEGETLEAAWTPDGARRGVCGHREPPRGGARRGEPVAVARGRGRRRAAAAHERRGRLLAARVHARRRDADREGAAGLEEVGVHRGPAGALVVAVARRSHGDHRRVRGRRWASTCPRPTAVACTSSPSAPGTTGCSRCRSRAARRRRSARSRRAPTRASPWAARPPRPRWPRSGRAPSIRTRWAASISPPAAGRRCRASTPRGPRPSTGSRPRNSGSTSRRGKRIHNLLVKPPGFDPGKKYPLFVVIHGGPHNMWKDDFVVRWNYHLLGSPGYVVLLTNYSGSTGFGEDVRAQHPGRPARGAGERDQPGGGRGDQALSLHRRLAAGGGRRELRRAPRELARGRAPTATRRS